MSSWRRLPSSPPTTPSKGANAGLALALPGCEPVLGVELIEAVLVGEASEVGGASSAYWGCTAGKPPVRISENSPMMLSLPSDDWMAESESAAEIDLEEPCRRSPS